MAESKGKVLCIENEPDMIDLIRLILTRRGYQVLGATGGEDGLALMQRELPQLVLLDLMMPGMDGWAVHRAIRADPQLRDTPIILVTAKVHDIEEVLSQFSSRVDAYVTKPFGPLELVAAVERVMSRRKVNEG